MRFIFCAAVPGNRRAKYELHLRDLVAIEHWLIRRLEFATELVFLVTKEAQNVL